MLRKRRFPVFFLSVLWLANAGSTDWSKEPLAVLECPVECADVGQVLFRGHMSCKSNAREVLKCIDKFGYAECVRCVI